MRRFLLFIISPVLLTTTGELLLKNTLNHFHEFIFFSNVISIKSLIMLMSLGIILSGGILWLIGMSKFQISFMYPFLGLNYLGIIFGSYFLLHEKINIYTFLSALFIVLGLILISKSKHAKSSHSSEKNIS